MDDSNPQLPFELVEIIVSEFWYSEHTSDDRITFMTACPLISRLWRDIYAHITSRNIYVPTVPYLFYLCSTIHSQKSSIYRPFLPESTRTITCHVDLLKSNSDSAMFPYVVLCDLPNYTGFRKCFPNIQYIHLETKSLPGPYCRLSHRLIRTRLSIRLDQATTQRDDLPVDWCITVDDPPDIGEVDPSILERSWMSFLCEVVCDMNQYSWRLRCMFDMSSHFSAAKSSTCSGRVRSFHGRTCCEERSKDMWGINHRFWKAGRTCTSLKTFFSDLYDELCWDDFPEVKLPMWRRTFGVD
ncbi:uncharacterized protein EV420DRAFT_542016 [Desarmillaria tabescens]|uniref:Uncharacterized protein n=1 Tax=Armillaria tabescens TaxID=1929756 RepID=A0AA39KE52_ARMTA|nr:uncharacterized protein EV420DRAFT_542016 [Desarmillaria tabescens]KAK0457138.1 hypothetical protein EV420DRAFT_542016 [Desarmillaria tabescens]